LTVADVPVIEQECGDDFVGEEVEFDLDAEDSE
jgi:hypothetical protein